MSKTVSGTVLACAKPPEDVMIKVASLVEDRGLAKEYVKMLFYCTLALDSLDYITNMDDRCRQAITIMIAYLEIYDIEDFPNVEVLYNES